MPTIKGPITIGKNMTEIDSAKLNESISFQDVVSKEENKNESTINEKHTSF